MKLKVSLNLRNFVVYTSLQFAPARRSAFDDPVYPTPSEVAQFLKAVTDECSKIMLDIRKEPDRAHLFAQADPECIADVSTPPSFHLQPPKLLDHLGLFLIVARAVKTKDPVRVMLLSIALSILTIHLLKFGRLDLSLDFQDVSVFVQSLPQILHHSLEPPQTCQELRIRWLPAPSRSSSWAWEYTFRARFAAIRARMLLVASDLSFSARGAGPWVDYGMRRSPVGERG